MKVAISQRFLPHYRVPFFDLVVRTLGAQGHETTLYYSFHIGKVGEFVWAKRLVALRKVVKLGEITETIGFAPALFFRLLVLRPAVLVVEDLAGLPNSLAAAVYCRLFRKPYLVWGLGNIPRKKTSRFRYWMGPFIRFLYSGATGFICYNERAARIYGQTGKPTFVAANACMALPSEEAHRAVLARIAVKYDGDSVRVVYIGELKAQKRVDVLLMALAQLQDLAVGLDIVGEGPERARLGALVEELCLSGVVRFCGAIYDAERKAEIFMDAGLCVLPGRGGLVVQELMSYGVPVICGTADGTEADFIVAGRNGVVLEDATDPAKLAAAMRAFVVSSADEKRRMATDAHMTIMNGWHIENMANAYCRAVLTAARAP